MQPESDDDKSKRHHRLSTQLETSSAQKGALWFIPYGFGCAIAVCGLVMFLSQSPTLCVGLSAVNAALLFGGITSFFVVYNYYDYRTKAIAKKLFRQKKEKVEVDFVMPLVDTKLSASLRRWTGLNYDWVHEGEGANVPPGMGRFIVSYGTFALYFVVFFNFVNNQQESNLLSYFWKDLLKAVFLIAATYVEKSIQVRAFIDLRDTYNVVAKNSNIHYLLKADAVPQIENK